MKNNGYGKKFTGWPVLLALLTFLTVMFFGCNEAPTTVGYSVVYDTVVVLPITSDSARLITGTDTYVKHFAEFNIGRYFIGRAFDLESFALMRFRQTKYTFGAAEDSINVFTNKDQFVSAKLVIYPDRYIMGDSLSNILQFDIYRTDPYYTNESTCDSFRINNHIDYNTKYGEFSGNIPLVTADTLDSLVIDLDISSMKDLLWEWMQAQQLMQVNPDTLIPDPGIALVSSENSTVLRSFRGQLTGSGGVHPYLLIGFMNSENQLDTFSFGSNLDGSIICHGESEPGYMTIQGGIQLRGELSFNIDTIPHMAAINKAQLELHVNPALSYRGNMDYDSVLYGVTFSGGRSGAITSQNYAAWITGTDMFSFNTILGPFEYWLRGDGKGTITFAPDPGNYVASIQRLDRLVFYGTDAENPAKRPKLRLIYSTRPDFNYNCTQK